MTGSPLAFIDVETTGLDPDRHEIWEVALILRVEAPGEEIARRSGAGRIVSRSMTLSQVVNREYLWQLPVDLGRADPKALEIGGYHKRRGMLGAVQISQLSPFASEFARLTRGAHLVGAVVSFDEERLRKLLRANGACPEWHYHLIDVEALAVGWLHGVVREYPGSRAADFIAQGLPWNSSDLSSVVGVDPDAFEKHTALGDARWAMAIYDSVVSR